MRFAPWVCCAALVSMPAAAIELKNDGFAGGQVSFQAGFAIAESAAVKLDSPFATGQVTAVHLLFGGATTTQTVTLTLWEDAAGTAPGTVIFSGDFQITGSDTAMQQLDLSALGVQVGSAFRVGVTFQHAGLPSVAVDTDGLSGSNYVQANMVGWVGASTVGLTGDFIIRAEVISTVDAGVADAGVDAGAVDAGAVDAGMVADAGASDAGVADAGGPVADAGVGGCATNAECASGSYCDSAVHRCTFDCRQASDCGAAMVCSSLGKCVGDGKPSGCGCSSIPGAVMALLGLLSLRRRRR